MEGFDEPFSTMKAIAEYFRDLAADDRYFGAEPPTPDTEMLHQIAERTIQRRVAAELAENGVILRQTEANQKAAPDAPALAVEMPKPEAREEQSAPQQAQVMRSVSDVPNAPQQTPVRAVVAPTMAAPEFGGGDTVAEKLQRIRAVVARENAAPAPYSEDQHAVEFSALDYEDEDKDTPTSAVGTFAGTGFEDEETLDSVAAGLTDSDASEGVAEDAASDEVEAEQPTQTEAIEEDQPKDEGEVAQEMDEANTVSDVEADDATAADAIEVAADAEAVAPADEADDAQEADAIDEATESEALHDAVAKESSAEDISPLRTQPRRRIVVEKISRAEIEAAQATKDAELPPEMEAELLAELAEVEAEVTTFDSAAIEKTEAEGPEAANTKEESQGDDADDILSRLSASFDVPSMEADDTAKALDLDNDDSAEDVLKSLMSDDSADVDLDEVETEVEAESDVEVKAEDQDDAEPEAEVAAEAQLEDDADAETEVEAEAEVDAQAATDTDETEAPHHDEPKRKSFAAMAEDDAIERLMSTTSSRLESDESSVRRASIAHLKAAVAATKADRSIAEAADKREEEELDQYRDDLARVVRPSRPVASSSRSDRPSPLVLVSEQRIDRPEEAPDAVAASAASADIRPRRVTRGNLALQEEMEEEFEDENLFAENSQITFAEYASKAGALELPDLLEAAAAHYTEIEGAEHFTRPMLMRKLAQVSSGPEGPSREDGLRAFGTLLRTGKIVKTDNGKFQLSKSSRFA
ncbi:midas domain-containing protein [Litoreibacter arenae]|uniref:Lipoprotein, putative n=1 Tax=Litoreibacter arenae DSM 19593 TaxID=1123360 RepID=S9QF44_9RHOB|nr:hypothetical protein [Litoreibacter arenae]EPX80036.1 lipoprotein, putative [Litoreibacter arenae DSM 19593]